MKAFRIKKTLLIQQNMALKITYYFDEDWKPTCVQDSTNHPLKADTDITPIL